MTYKLTRNGGTIATCIDRGAALNGLELIKRGAIRQGIRPTFSGTLTDMTLAIGKLEYRIEEEVK